jgi:hypothetical protein
MRNCLTKSVATDHSTPADDYKLLSSGHRNVHLRFLGNASERVVVGYFDSLDYLSGRDVLQALHATFPF